MDKNIEKIQESKTPTTETLLLQEYNQGITDIDLDILNLDICSLSLDLNLSDDFKK